MTHPLVWNASADAAIRAVNILLLPLLAQAPPISTRRSLRSLICPLLVRPLQNSDGYYSYVVDYGRGIMLLDMYQPSMSKIVRREIDPLEWTEIFGNVGGFWGECFRALTGGSPPSGVVCRFSFTPFSRRCKCWSREVPFLACREAHTDGWKASLLERGVPSAFQSSHRAQ